jgi:hypothetical protein
MVEGSLPPLPAMLCRSTHIGVTGSFETVSWSSRTQVLTVVVTQTPRSPYILYPYYVLLFGTFGSMYTIDALDTAYANS